jgi:hypothetical protein
VKAAALLAGATLLLSSGALCAHTPAEKKEDAAARAEHQARVLAACRGKSGDALKACIRDQYPALKK